MANEITFLHARCISFAGDMPAVAISSSLIYRDVAQIESSLRSAATYPDKPAPSLSNFPLSTNNGIAYSLFIRNLRLVRSGSDFRLDAAVTVTVHPVGAPGDVIKFYEISSALPSYVYVDYDVVSGTVSWRDDGTEPDVVANWNGSGPSDPAVTDALKKTKLPSPQDTHFENDIEPRVKDNARSFLKVLTKSILPKYGLHEIVPWLRFQEPVKVDADDDYIIVTGEATTSAPVGDCKTEQIPVPHDPTFPNHPVPAPSLQNAEIDFAVYARQLVFSDFFSAHIAAPIDFSDSKGSLIRIEFSGPIMVAPTIAGEPLVVARTNQGPAGTFELYRAEAVMGFLPIDIVVEGPCTTRRTSNVDGLSGSAFLGGQIDFEALISKRFVGSVNGRLRFTNYSRIASSVNNGDPVVVALLGQTDAEVDKAFGVLMANKERECNWVMFEMPLSYLQSIPPAMLPAAHAEGLIGVSGLVAMVRQHIG